MPPDRSDEDGRRRVVEVKIGIKGRIRGHVGEVVERRVGVSSRKVSTRDRGERGVGFEQVFGELYQELRQGETFDRVGHALDQPFDIQEGLMDSPIVPLTPVPQTRHS